MSSSELRYLIAASTLAEGGAAVKQKDIAGKLGVSKVSAYNAVERLRERQARLESSLRFAHRRLLAAFPTMRTRRGREALTRLREAAQAGREKLRRRRGREE